MNVFNVSTLQNSSVLFIYTERERIQLDPPYQRYGDVWTLEKRQLLVDSILNGFDIPKIYFHKFAQPKKVDDATYDFAIVDGRQRLETLWKFIDGDFALGADFEYLRDPAVQAAEMTYQELGRKYPRLKIRLDSYSLDVVTIETDDEDLIEDMFSRLNEAVPLSAAEKRNALGGPLPGVIRRLAKHPLFAEKLPFTNRRYRHYDLCAKLLLAESERAVVDTKKIYLDEFVKEWRKRSEGEADALGKRVRSVLGHMRSTFTENDPLLRSVGNIMLYYYTFRLAQDGGWLNEITRDQFASFENARIENREKAATDLGEADYSLLEFDRYVQSPNDAYAMIIRLNVMLRRLFDRGVPPEAQRLWGGPEESK